MGADPALFADSFRITEDLDLDEKIFDPIGGREYPFSGILDGDGHAIENLVIRGNDDEFVGLFGWVGSRGEVTGVQLERSFSSGYQSVGGLVGYNVDRSRDRTQSRRWVWWA